MLKSLLGQNNIHRIAKCGQGVLIWRFEYGGFYSKVNTEILHSSTAAERLCEFRENRSYDTIEEINVDSKAEYTA